MTKDLKAHILREIVRITGASGGSPPGRVSFENQTGIRLHDWLGKYWARWGDALIEAGFSPNIKNPRIDRDVLFEKLAQAFRHYGRIPTSAELALYKRIETSFPSGRTLEKHFPTKADMISLMRDWIAENPSYDDIGRMLPDTEVSPRSGRTKGRIDGIVYLIQSGAHYKIGRSDQLERRIKEIRIALPEAATLIHSITTDDPSGIEAYWHRRYADKRANGEWFKLFPEDIAAFKRRKYQ